MEWLVATSLHSTIPKRQEDYSSSSTCKEVGYQVGKKKKKVVALSKQPVYVHINPLFLKWDTLSLEVLKIMLYVQIPT